jgi:nucleotide-binding universal stress UspA family protein
MFRNVLVPVDEVRLAEAALPWALAAAGPSGAVHLVHAHLLAAPVAVEGMLLSSPSEDATLRGFEAEALDRLADRVRAAAPGVTVTARTIDPDGPFIEALTGAAADTSSELVVVATHARGPLARFVLGSVTDELVRHSPVPVLVVRPPAGGAAADLSARPRLDHLVIPLDGSALAERIIDPAVRLGHLFGADYTLVLVTDPHPSRDPQRPTDSLTAAETYLRGAAKSVFERKGVAWPRVVQTGSPVEAVLGIAGEVPLTGIALATQGRSGIGRLLHGSVADEVIRKASGPVLVFHPPGR